MSLLYVTLLIAASGLFGGLAAAIFEIEANHLRFKTFSSMDWDNFTHRQKVLFCMGRTTVGAAGAFGVVLAALWLDKLELEATVNNTLFLICLGVVAGSASHHLLPRIGYKLSEQILNESREASKKAAEAERTVEQVKDKLDIVEDSVADLTAQYNAAITLAEFALGDEESDDYSAEAIERLHLLETKFPKDADLHILLGCLLKRANRCKEAITLLEQYIQLRNCPTSRLETTSFINRSECAVAYFNIACYESLLSATDGLKDGEKEHLQESALAHLKIAGNLRPKWRESAIDDPDFEPIKDLPAFREYVAAVE